MLTKWDVMRRFAVALGLLMIGESTQAKPMIWQPPEGIEQIALWPGVIPDARPAPGPEDVSIIAAGIAGKPNTNVTNVTNPTISVYPPKGNNTGAALVVIPGGGFQNLAIDLEGTEACDWATSIGITCVLLKYRVPSAPYDWQCDCRPQNLSISEPSLQDLQRTMRIVRAHAEQWHVDPHKVGVMGFSAGGYLVAEISALFDRPLYPKVDNTDDESARPDFAMPIYPGHLAKYPGHPAKGDDMKLNANIPVSSQTPPTFLVQAEDDYEDGINQSLVYYAALSKAHIPAEMHLYANGGHAFGFRRTELPITGWPAQAEAWLRTIGMVQN